MMMKQDIPPACEKMFTHALINTVEQLNKVIHTLSAFDTIAFDSEGDNLGRTGALTVATVMGICSADAKTRNSSTIAFVIDVVTLGASVVFSSTSPSLKSILENASITKITFDCRSDSDALFHQFGVTLRGVIDTQVLDQAVRIQNGQAPPIYNEFVTRGGVQFMQGMAKVASRYLDNKLREPLFDFGNKAPHKCMPHNDQLHSVNVWLRRPLEPSSIAYAASDVHIIQLMYAKMCQVKLLPVLYDGVVKHSARYERYFRDTESHVRTRDFTMREHPIVQLDQLPKLHPQKFVTLALEAWYTVVSLAAQPTGSLGKYQINRLYNKALYVLHHNRWYTDAGCAYIQQLVLTCGHYMNNTQRRYIEMAYLGTHNNYDMSW